jgi:hypothetical protein
LLSLLVLQTNNAKNWITTRVLELVGQQTDHRITIETVSIDWFDMVSVYEATLFDSRDSVMFSAGELTINYSLFDLVRDSKFSVEGLTLSNAELNLRKYDDASSINILTFLSKLSGQTKSDKKAELSLNSWYAKDLKVGYKDFRLDSGSLNLSRFNPSWFDFDIDHMQARALWLRNDSLQIEVQSLKAKEFYSGFPIEEFSSVIGLFPSAMVFDDLQMKTEESFLADSLVLSFDRPSQLAYIKDSVVTHLDLKDAKLSLKDLTYFGEIPEINESLSLSGSIDGRLSNLTISDFRIVAEDNSSMNLNASLMGLPELSETFMDLRIRTSAITSSRVRQFFPDQQLNHGDLQFEGSLTGFLSDFVAYGNIETVHGIISSDINLKLSENISQSRYIGNLELNQFDLGSLIGNDKLGTLDFNGSIDGGGFTLDDANFNLKAEARNIEFDHYSYDTIIVNGDFKAHFFDGSLRLSDDRGKVSGIAIIDFLQDEERVILDLKIDSLDLYSFGLSRRPSWLSNQLQAELKEVSINETHGKIQLQETKIVNEQIGLEVDSVLLNIVTGDKKSYLLSSELADIELSGNFDLTDLYKDLPSGISAYKSYFALGQPVSVHAEDEIFYQTQLNIQLKNTNPLLALLDLPVRISEGSQIEISYDHKNDISFGVYAFVDTLSYEDRVFFKNEVLVDASKDEDSQDILALMQVSSQEQIWNDKISTQRMSVEAIWSQNNIASSFKIAQEQNRSRANVRSLIQLRKDTIEFKILPSDLIVFDTEWSVNQENQIRLLNERYIINNLEIYNGPQLVSLNGVISDSLLTQLNVEFEKFDLLTLSSLSPRKVGGIIDANARVSRENALRPLRFETDISVQNLSFEDILIGNLQGTSEWDRSENGLYIDYLITRQNINTIDLAGYFRPFDEDQLDLQANFQEANLKLIEPLFESLISNLSGEATGELSLTGKLARPKLRGVSTLNHGKVTINYLNTTYSFSGVTRFFEEQIAFDNIRVRDRFNHSAALNGAINHVQFDDIFLNVSLNFDQFELLNTNRQHNSLYYGNAYGSGSMKMSGPVENILISAEATSAQNTKVFIPLISESSAEQGAFITFRSKDTTNLQADESLNLSGVSIDFDMDITPDAYIELIFNPRTGDIIRGTGNGNMQLTVTSTGDFDLFGSYAVQEGAYNFTTSVFNKEFQVLPGGTINWFGDPYAGLMDISASYRQIANIYDWSGDAEDQTTQRRPVLVVLDMEGPMMQPDIRYHLELADQTTTDLSSSWNQDIASINADEEELKRQVFSLLVLRKFSPQASFVVGGQSLTDGFSSSMGELLSNQLSYWLNQVDENLEIDLDLNSLSAEAFNTFQLQLAYSFLDGRLRVTRGGGFTTIVEEDASIGTDLQNIIGDWSVEYILTENGKLRMRFFSRNNQYNGGAQSTAQQGQETGLSLQYVTSFDEFSKIIKNSRKENQSNQSGTTE